AEKILKRYCRKAVDAVVALSNYSTSHTRFRDFLTRLYGNRYASMPLFDISMFEGPMAVDYKALERLTKKVATLVTRAHELKLTTPYGTDLRVLKKGRKTMADTGNLRRPGSFGNLPAGEAFFAPLEGTAEGRMVLQWGPTRKLTSEVVLHVKDGLVQKVEGNEVLVDELERRFSERWENRNIAEVGIGTNPKASRPDNILESEKILGTVHVALGDNSSFGGKVKTPFHQDFVFFHPTVVLRFRGGRETVLIEEGKLLVE
ncbi:MAG: peptidase, partial [Nitrospirae bacterium]